MNDSSLTLPAAGGGISDETVSFAAALTDRSGKAPVIEAALAHPTGRRRPLPVRAVLTALVCLALDDRPLHLTEATRLLFHRISDSSRALLGVTGTARGHRGFPGRLPAGPLLLPRCLLGHGPLAAAEEPPAERRGPHRPDQADDPRAGRGCRGRLEAFINALHGSQHLAS